MLASRIAPVRTEIASRFLEGISPADLNVILAAARPRQFKANSVILSQGNPADHLYLLTKGRTRCFFMTEDCRKLLLFWLSPGEIMGGAALLANPSLYLACAETLKDSQILVWDRPAIRELAAR